MAGAGVGPSNDGRVLGGDGGGRSGISPIRFPAMRAQLVEMLEAITDPEEVRRAWIDHDPSSGLTRGGWLPAHVIDHIDDCAELDDPSSMFGVTLRTSYEVTLVAQLDVAVDPIDCQCSDTETVLSSAWAAMVPAARALLAELSRNDRLAEPDS